VAKSSKERMAALRERQKSKGRSQVQLWLTTEEEMELKDYLKVLRGSVQESDAETNDS